MTRILYRCLLWMHPPRFRREFADEMLLIFDESSASEGASALFLDAATSLVRQWIVRSAIWKPVAAVAGGWLTLAAGLVMRPRPPHAWHTVSTDPQTAMFLVIAVASFMAISFTLILCVSWFRFSLRRRA